MIIVLEKIPHGNSGFIKKIIFIILLFNYIFSFSQNPPCNLIEKELSKKEIKARDFILRFDKYFTTRNDSLSKIEEFNVLKGKKEHTFSIIYFPNGKVKEFIEYRNNKICNQMVFLKTDLVCKRDNYILKMLNAKSTSDTISHGINKETANYFHENLVVHTKDDLLKVVLLKDSIQKKFQINENITVCYNASKGFNVKNISIIDSNFRKNNIYSLTGLDYGAIPKFRTYSENKSTKEFEIKEFTELEKKDEFMGYALTCKEFLKSTDEQEYYEIKYYSIITGEVIDCLTTIKRKNNYEFIYRSNDQKQEEHTILELEYYNKK